MRASSILSACRGAGYCGVISDLAAGSSFGVTIRYLAPDFGQEVARDDMTQTSRHPREYAIQG